MKKSKKMLKQGCEEGLKQLALGSGIIYQAKLKEQLKRRRLERNSEHKNVDAPREQK